MCQYTSVWCMWVHYFVCNVAWVRYCVCTSVWVHYCVCTRTAVWVHHCVFAPLLFVCTIVCTTKWVHYCANELLCVSVTVRNARGCLRNLFLICMRTMGLCSKGEFHCSYVVCMRLEKSVFFFVVLHFCWCAVQVHDGNSQCGLGRLRIQGEWSYHEFILYYDACFPSPLCVICFSYMTRWATSQLLGWLGVLEGRC